MNYLLVLAILIIIVLYFVNSNSQPTQGDIQDDSYINEKELKNGFPYPQLSRSFKQLSNGKLPSPLNNLSDILPSGGKELQFTRESNGTNLAKQRLYLPDYYRKDRLSQNPSGTEELRPFITNENESEQSWTDVNVSEHPKFYNSEIQDEITNIGAFFDMNNQYNDKTSIHTDSITSDSCFKDKNDNYFCEDNTRKQLIPPKLISDPDSCYLLNTVGTYKNGNVKNNKDDTKDRVMNGGLFFNNVNASLEKNETWSQPIEIQTGDCSI